MRRFGRLLLLALGLSSFACARGNRPFDSGVQVHSRNAVLFFVDGLDTERLEALDVAAQTPNIRKYFLEGGLHFTNAAACFPTVTYSNAVSLMTGRYPGRHGVTANAWFDRSTQRHVDYTRALTYLTVDRDYQAKTIYELIAPGVTSSVQCAAARGVTWRWQSQLANGLNWAFGDYEAVDTRVGSRVSDVIRRSRRRREWPVFQTYYFPGVDKVAHTHGVASHRYAAAVANVDTQIGAVVSAIEAAVGADRTFYVLVSDHGQMDCGGDHDLDVTALLRERTKLRIHEARPQGVSDNCDAIVLPGRRHVMIHVRSDADWNAPPRDNDVMLIVDALSAEETRENAGSLDRTPIEGIRCIYYRLSGGRIGVRDRTGQRLVMHVDPSARKAAHLEPSAFDQELSALFDSPRAGDVIAFADKSHVFQQKDCGGHGGASPRERRIPLFVNGPGVASGTHCDEPVRIIDVMPTILDLIGMKDRLPSDIDGRSLAPIIFGAPADHRGVANNRGYPRDLQTLSATDRSTVPYSGIEAVGDADHARIRMN
ncbi:MAG: alkaline phosphatase family protein [Phycisphaerales bacterium]|nr:alkaline phosphatase family protein [Phycisphaerales bacterium]MCB9864476.1 alkaline phosphatase family protein [Phycisphaerales bacterium]